MQNSIARKPRYYVLDAIRGFSVISMILFHTGWDLVHIFGVKIAWYESLAGDIWKYSICFAFILLSGFCISMGRHRLKNSLTILLSGGLVTIVTRTFLPSGKIVFGILTLIGSCMLISIPLQKLLARINPYIASSLCILLFAAGKSIYKGTLFFCFKLPETLYRNSFTAYLGFPPNGFYSADYFPIFPWIFLFFAGYFLYEICKKHSLLKYLEKSRAIPLEWIGRHSLMIYLLHQPVIFVILILLFNKI